MGLVLPSPTLGVGAWGQPGQTLCDCVGSLQELTVPPFTDTVLGTQTSPRTQVLPRRTGHHSWDKNHRNDGHFTSPQCFKRSPGLGDVQRRVCYGTPNPRTRTMRIVPHRKVAALGGEGSRRDASRAVRKHSEAFTAADIVLRQP